MVESKQAAIPVMQLGGFVRLHRCGKNWFTQRAFGLIGPDREILMMTQGLTYAGRDEGSVGKSVRRLLTSSQPD